MLVWLTQCITFRTCSWLHIQLLHNAKIIDMNMWSMAAKATLHCLTGCAIGEIVGMVISTAGNWASAPSIVLSIALAFVFGYGLTIFGLRGHRMSLRQLLGLAFAADTVSISVMELSDNGFVLLVPGAISAGLSTGLFWWSLLTSLVVAFVVTVPVNRWLLAKGKGHAAVHDLHHH
jgi:hypothetical protein